MSIARGNSNSSIKAEENTRADREEAGETIFSAEMLDVKELEERTRNEIHKSIKRAADLFSERMNSNVFQRARSEQGGEEMDRGRYITEDS